MQFLTSPILLLYLASPASPFLLLSPSLRASILVLGYFAFSRQPLFPALPRSFPKDLTTSSPPHLSRKHQLTSEGLIGYVSYNPWHLAWFCNVLLLCQTTIKPCVPYHWNICPLILVCIIKKQATPHHVAHLKPRPATLPGLLAVLLLPPESIGSNATQHFARAENQTCFLAWLTETEYRALPKDSFLFAKSVSLRIRWWFSVFLFLLWKLPLFSIPWSGYVWCLLTALWPAATKTVGST